MQVCVSQQQFEQVQRILLVLTHAKLESQQMMSSSAKYVKLLEVSHDNIDKSLAIILEEERLREGWLTQYIPEQFQHRAAVAHHIVLLARDRVLFHNISLVIVILHDRLLQD